MLNPEMRRVMTQVYLDGDNAVKVGATGFGMIYAALVEQAATLGAALLVSFWLLDVLLGTIRAASREGGFDNFSWEKARYGGLKLVAAVGGIALATLIDLSAKAAWNGYEADMLAVGAMSGMSISFAFSAAKSFKHFFPVIGQKIENVLSRGGEDA